MERIGRAARRAGGWIARRWDRGRRKGKRLVSESAWPRIVLISVVAAFGVLTLARSADLPERSVWKPGSPLTWILLATGLVAAVSGVVNTIRATRRRRDATLSEACLQLAAYIDDECPNIPLRAVGVHVWIARGAFFTRRLRRGPEFRLRHRRRSGIIFRKGVGLVGRAWESRTTQIEDLEQRFAHVSTAVDYAALTRTERFGLTWEEFERTRDYKAIWAEPLFQHSEYGSEVVGVLSVDIAESGVYSEFETAVRTSPGDELEAILKACETQLSR